MVYGQFNYLRLLKIHHIKYIPYSINVNGLIITNFSKRYKSTDIDGDKVQKFENPDKAVNNKSTENISLLEDDKLYRRFERIKAKPNFGYSAFGLLIMIVYGLGMYIYLNKKERELKENRDRVIRRQKHLSTIGGNFNLIDTNGQRLTQEDLKGCWVLLYFGFTHCPDVCPDTLDRMVEIYNHLKEVTKDETIKLVFITVDPERDDPKAIKEYLDDFHSDFIGLTGSIDEIKQVTKDFHVFFDSHRHENEDDYLVDHTTLIYLLNPIWKFIDYYALDMDTSTVVENVLKQMTYYHSPI